MKKLFKLIALVLTASFVHFSAYAADAKATPDEAIAMVKAVITSLKANGKEKTFAEIADTSNKKFHDRELYVVVFDLKGFNVAHGNNPKIVGKDLINMKDADDTFITKNFIKIATSPQGNGWFDYKWKNPVSGEIEKKSTYIQKADGDILVGVGIYK